MKPGGSKIQGYPQVHSKSEASLGYMRPCYKRKKESAFPVKSFSLRKLDRMLLLTHSVHQTGDLDSMSYLFHFKNGVRKVFGLLVTLMSCLISKQVARHKGEEPWVTRVALSSFSPSCILFHRWEGTCERILHTCTGMAGEPG